MNISDNELLSVQNTFNKLKTAYLEPETMLGSYSADQSKRDVLEVLNKIEDKIERKNNYIQSFSKISDQQKANALTVATSGDSGLILASLNDAIEKGSYNFVFSVSDLIQKSNKIDDSTKYQVKRIREKAEKLSGFDSEYNTLEQSKVIKKEIETYLENIGKVDLNELKRLTNFARSTAEIGYVRDKMKRNNIS